MNKQIYYDKMSTRIDELEARIKLTGAKLKSHAVDAQLAAGNAADELRPHVTIVRAKLDQMKNAAEGTWERMKEEIEGAWHDLERRFGSDKTQAKSDDKSS